MHGMRTGFALGAVALATTLLTGCYGMRPSAGGGQTQFTPPRQVSADDVAAPAGYRVEVVATGLTFPTGIAFDGEGRAYVVESGYSYGEVFTTPQLLRLEPAGRTTAIARGTKNGPWTGVAWADGTFYVAEGGQMEGGRILRIGPDGVVRALLEKLPGMGDHHTNGPVVGPDGAIYFGQGTATNSAVVGPDNAKFGWLKRFPKFHDTPCRDIRLAGDNFESADAAGTGTARTGAFMPFGQEAGAGQVIRGTVPCSGSVMRVAASGGAVELVAWGFRNPFGLAFSPDGTLYVTDNGYDDRGSRPVWGTGDLLWAVKPGTWYGWPDFSGDRSLTEPEFRPPGKPPLRHVLAEHPNTPPKPAAILGVHSSSDGFDFSRSELFGYVGNAFIAQVGDEAPTTGKVLAPVGFKVVRVDVKTGVIDDFVANKGPKNGPASRIGSRGLERPIAARFNPRGDTLYVVDFGVLLHDEQGAKPQAGTGVVWRVTRAAAR